MVTILSKTLTYCLYLKNSGKGKLLNNFSASLELFFKQTFYSININRVGYERRESSHCDEDNFIAQSNIIPNSFDST